MSLYGKYTDVIDEPNLVRLPDILNEFREERPWVAVRTLPDRPALVAVMEKRTAFMKPYQHPDSYGAILRIDEQGRIAIPGHLLAYARLERQSLIVGLGWKFEIWNPEVFESEGECPAAAP